MTARPARAAAALAGALLLAAGLAAPRAPVAAPGAAPREAAGGDSVGEAALYLSWRAPHGQPGALADLPFACDDTTRVDTLYLSFETGRDGERFHGMYGRLSFLPAPGETLGAYWDLRRDGAHPGGVGIQFDPDDSFPCARPWLWQGGGAPRYEFGPHGGSLDLVYAVREDDAAPVSGRTRYCFARVLVPHRRCELPGARQPLCIEWREARYSLGADDVAITRGPARFVSLNSPGGGVCAPYRRRPPAPAPWSPRPGGPPAAPADSAGR